MGSTRSGIRWRDDGWELRCVSCAKNASTTCYWPLTEEFWDRRTGMVRCRACHRIGKNQRDRRQYAVDQQLRARRTANARLYRIEAAPGIKVKRDQRRPADATWQRQSYWLDPEKHRATARARYHRNRDAILARRRAAYAAGKAA